MLKPPTIPPVILNQSAAVALFNADGSAVEPTSARNKIYFCLHFKHMLIFVVVFYSGAEFARLGNFARVRAGHQHHGPGGVLHRDGNDAGQDGAQGRTPARLLHVRQPGDDDHHRLGHLVSIIIGPAHKF